jgi:hypothetical protein
MTYEEIIKFYGTAYMVSKKVGFAPGTPFNWRRLGYVPEAAQLKIARHSDGELKYKYEDSFK